jgi:hypothetical protein
MVIINHDGEIGDGLLSIILSIGMFTENELQFIQPIIWLIMVIMVNNND